MIDDRDLEYSIGGQSPMSQVSSEVKQTAQIFARDKYVVLQSLLGEARVSRYCKRALAMAQSGQWIPDKGVPHAPAGYGEPWMESLLLLLLPRIERATVLSLYPTFSYIRIYKSGDVLRKHMDRKACEISVSLSLGYAADDPWPLWIEGPSGASRVTLKPGDGIVYRGIECAHWREPFQGEYAVQVFLHYVDQNGRYADWKFDKRSGLGQAPVIPAGDGLFLS